MPTKTAKTSRPLMVIGWHECISLPQLGLLDFAVKVDTGARTTALHASQIETFDRDGQHMVRFLPPEIASGQPDMVELPVLEERDITNTSGVPERRLVIQTPMVIAKRRWTIDVSLTDRGSMRFPLILGRSALRGHNIAVHPGRSYMISEKPPNPAN